jgi:hypothetical protein
VPPDLKGSGRDVKGRSVKSTYSLEAYEGRRGRAQSPVCTVSLFATYEVFANSFTHQLCENMSSPLSSAPPSEKSQVWSCDDTWEALEPSDRRALQPLTIALGEAEVELFTAQQSGDAGRIATAEKAVTPAQTARETTMFGQESAKHARAHCRDMVSRLSNVVAETFSLRGKSAIGQYRRC